MFHFCQMDDIENAVMAHRYLFHVMKLPILTDAEYDFLAATARQRLPQTYKTHSPGSLYSSPEDYTEQQRRIAVEVALCS